ncbi:hypothetical protein ABK040_005608 [Willaertia magna]
MAKRSLLKRLTRFASKANKGVQKKALGLENSVSTSFNKIAGEQYVNELSQLQSYEEIHRAQQDAKERYIKLTAAAVPHKIQQFKQEFSHFRQLLSNPGEVTVGELSIFVAVLVAGYVFYRGGEILGRGDINGYKYDEQK